MADNRKEYDDLDDQLKKMMEEGVDSQQSPFMEEYTQEELVATSEILSKDLQIEMQADLLKELKNILIFAGMTDIAAQETKAIIDQTTQEPTTVYKARVKKGNTLNLASLNQNLTNYGLNRFMGLEAIQKAALVTAIKAAENRIMQMPKYHYAELIDPQDKRYADMPQSSVARAIEENKKEFQDILHKNMRVVLDGLTDFEYDVSTNKVNVATKVILENIQLDKRIEKSQAEKKEYSLINLSKIAPNLLGAYLSLEKKKKKSIKANDDEIKKIGLAISNVFNDDTVYSTSEAKLNQIIQLLEAEYNKILKKEIYFGINIFDRVESALKSEKPSSLRLAIYLNNNQSNSKEAGDYNYARLVSLLFREALSIKGDEHTIKRYHLDKLEVPKDEEYKALFAQRDVQQALKRG